MRLMDKNLSKGYNISYGFSHQLSAEGSQPKLGIQTPCKTWRVKALVKKLATYFAALTLDILQNSTFNIGTVSVKTMEDHIKDVFI